MNFMLLRYARKILNFAEMNYSGNNVVITQDKFSKSREQERRVDSFPH